MLKRINTFKRVTTGENHWVFVYKQHTPELNTTNPAKFKYYMTLEKRNIRNNHRVYLANSNREAFNHLRWCCWKNSTARVFGEKQKENMRSTERLEQAYTVLKLSMNHRWGQQKNCLSSSRSLGKCSSARFSSRLPLFPVPPTPGWGWEPPWAWLCRTGSLAYARLQFASESCCSLQCHHSKSPFLQFLQFHCSAWSRVRKALKDSPFSQENLNIIPSFLRYFTACTRR